MLASTAPGRRVPNPFSAVTSAAVSACMSVRSSNRGSPIRGAAGHRPLVRRRLVVPLHMAIQTRAQRGQCHHRHRIGVVIGRHDVPDGRQVVRSQAQPREHLRRDRGHGRQRQLSVQRHRFTAHRPVDVERAQSAPGPRQSAVDRCEMTPDQVDDINPQDLADIGEDRRGLTRRGRFGDGGNWVAHAALMRCDSV